MSAFDPQLPVTTVRIWQNQLQRGGFVTPLFQQIHLAQEGLVARVTGYALEQRFADKHG